MRKDEATVAHPVKPDPNAKADAPSNERTVAQVATEREESEARRLAKLSPTERERLKHEETMQRVNEKFDLPSLEEIAGWVGMSVAEVRAKFEALRLIYPEFAAWEIAATTWITQRLDEFLPRARAAFLATGKVLKEGKGPTRGSGVDLA